MMPPVHSKLLHANVDQGETKDVLPGNIQDRTKALYRQAKMEICL